MKKIDLSTTLKHYILPVFILGLLPLCVLGEESSLFTNLSGNVWVDADDNGLFNGEPGPDGVLMEIVDNSSQVVVQQSFTALGKYDFNAIVPGEYFIRIPSSQFLLGAPLFNTFSCAGFNDADDMVDNDDNGSPLGFNGVITSVFTLTDADVNNNVEIDYIDFCFEYICDSENPIASENCLGSNFNLICDVNTFSSFCYIMPTDISEGEQPSPICVDNDKADNITWFSFIAWDGVYSINISPDNCSGVGFATGVQVGVYADCDFEDQVFCTAGCTTNDISIPSNILSPGSTYYLFIDGCTNSVCTYQMSVTGTTLEPSLEPSDVCTYNNGSLVCDSIGYCLGSEAVFEATGLGFNANYSWLITTISGDPYDGPNPIMTSNENLRLTFNTEGVYEICVTDVDNGCFSWTGSKCRIIEITSDIVGVEDEIFSDQNICEGGIETFDINALNTEDPNGDGTFGWLGPVDDFSLGINRANIPTQNCSYDQEFLIDIAPDTPVEDVLLSVCNEDLPITIEGIEVTEASFSGTNFFAVNNFLIDTPNQYGCDSMINLEVNRVILVDGALSPGVCTFEGIILRFNYNMDISTSSFFFDYVWRNPNGQVISDTYNPSDPNDIIVPNGIDGDYTLTITINRFNSSCEYTFTQNIDFDSYLPSTPNLSGVNQVCVITNNIVEYTATGGDPTFNYIWDYPQDVMSASTSGALMSTLTIDWTGSAGGTVSLQSENACALSDLATTDVTVLTATTPEFIIDDEVCRGNQVDIEAISDLTGITNYQWDFADATVESGSDGGPYTLRFNTEGLKTITLHTTDINGCQSSETTGTINVIAPINPPGLSCQSALTDVLFIWNATSTQEYSVNVLTGQTGVFEDDGRYRVSNISPGEEVRIRLLTTVIGSVCTSAVISESTCFAQDCPPIPIVLSAVETTFCDSDDSQSININATVPAGISGNGVFSGPGITDPVGIFDPSQAPIGSSTITYIFTDENGCSGVESIVMTILENPTASFTVSSDEICITGSVALDYTGDPNVTQNYSASDNGIIDSANNTVSWNTAGTKLISLFVERDGCISETVNQSVSVSPTLGDISIACNAGEGFVEFVWDPVDGASTFEVTINDTNTFTTTQNSITVNSLESEEQVKLNLTAISDGPCDDVSALRICQSSTVSIDENELDKIILYPNPASHLLFIDGLDSELPYSIYSINGTLISQGLYTNGIDINGVIEGLYIIKLDVKNHQVFKKFAVR